MKRSVAMLSVGGLFLVGILVGSLGVHLYHVDHFASPEPRAPRFFLGHLERELQLTEDQRTRIDEILRQSHEDAERIRAELLPRVRARIEQTHESVREVLTPEQQKLFDELARRHPRPAERFLLGHPRHRGAH